MERKDFIGRLALLACLPSLFLAACSNAEKDNKTAAGKIQTYTCPMHPQIVQDRPGTCPVCGMDLVPFEKNNSDAALTLNENQMALANISTMVVGLSNFENYQQLNGRIVVDPEKTAYISSRVGGRLEALYVRQTGENVRKGQALYQIYSEQLLSLQQEYLLAAAQVAQFPNDQTFLRLLQGAKQKLALYGQSDGQIMQLQNKKQLSPYVTYYAPSNGTVAELSVSQGQYVSEGSPIMRLEDYQSLWVEADLYPAEAQNIKVGQSLKVIIPGWEEQAQTMTVKFINPELRTGTQLTQLRGSIHNTHAQWQPGLQANVFVPSPNKGPLISLPIDAVIRDGKGTHVWVQKEKGKFVPQAVGTGQAHADAIEIKTGLQTGDQVVVTGAYLLYSEYILKKGKNPMAQAH